MDLIHQKGRWRTHRRAESKAMLSAGRERLHGRTVPSARQQAGPAEPPRTPAAKHSAVEESGETERFISFV